MSDLAPIEGREPIGAMVQVVCDSVSSPSTKRNYRRAIEDFLTWYDSVGRPTLRKAVVQSYKTHLRDQGKSAANVNQRLSAIRKLATEAADNGALDPVLAQGIANVKGVRQEGHHVGNWLGKGQTERLLDAPDRTTNKGRRDRAILALLVGCGLRRAELASLTVDQIQQRDARWVIVDLVGKRNKIRTVPMPSWAKVIVDEWLDGAGITQGRVLRPVNRGDNVRGDSLTPQAVYNTVTAYAEDLAVDVAPHDLRRTFAKLAHKGGAPIEQIQHTLGHKSIETTELYLGVDQNLTDAPCDHLGLRVEVSA